MWQKVLETYQCLVSGIEKRPGMRLEDAFSSDALRSIKEEFEWLRKHAQRVSPEATPCSCPEFCTYHARMVFEEQKKRIAGALGRAAGELQEILRTCAREGNNGVLSVENQDNEPATDYILDPKAVSCWIAVDVFSIYIHRTDEGVVVDIFPRRSEMDEPMASAYAFTNDALPSCKECFAPVEDVDEDWDDLCDKCRAQKEGQNAPPPVA